MSMNEPLHQTTSNANQASNTESRQNGISDSLQQAWDDANNIGNKRDFPVLL